MPTVAETVPGYEALGWYGIGAPKKTPDDIIEKLNQAANKAISDPKAKARLADLGIEAMPMTSKEFTAFVMSENEKWTKVIRAAHVTLE
jgi:tripartite-type tricarboxylate transporter receptor subunit TctC